MTELERVCREVWGAYEYLYQNDLSDQSGTSKRLRAGDPTRLKARLVEEIGELRGVLEGTHFHEGFQQDIILEGYEVWYWGVCWAISLGLGYDQIRPAHFFQAGFDAPMSARPALLPLFSTSLKELEAALSSDQQDHAAVILDFLFTNVGQACQLNNTPPLVLIERDRAEMRQKDYLAPYWEAVAHHAIS